MATSAAAASDARDRAEADGFLVVSGLITRAEALRWREQVRAAVTGTGGGIEPSGVTVWMADALPADVAPMVLDPRLTQLAAAVIGTPIEFLSVKPVFKGRGVAFASPWHQDAAYWGGAPKWSIWLALGDVGPENGCLRVLPGSHRGGARDHLDVESKHGFGRRVDAATLDEERAVDVPLGAGSAVVFHDQLLHSSRPTLPGRERLALIPTYRSTAIADSSTVWQTARPVD